MTEQSPVSIDAVRELVAERRRFDDWLSALEGRRTDTPAHVYARVHGDYVTRRERVMAQLHTQAPVLSELLASLSARSEALAARMGAQEDERTEAMLRHAVGEFDDASWHAVRERVEASVQQMGGEHGELERQRADVRQLLSEAQPTVAAAVASAVAPPELSRADSAPLETDGSETPSWLTDDDLTADVEAPASAAPVESGSMAPPRDHTVHRVVSITEPLAAIEPDGVAEAQDLYGDTTADRGVAADRAGAAPPAESFDDLAFLRSVIDPQSQNPSVPKAPFAETPQKTLRCTECSTMNLPTEWYCERCGGELATF